MIAATEFAPDFTIISAGFDAARGDPLGCCDVRILLCDRIVCECFLSSHLTRYTPASELFSNFIML